VAAALMTPTTAVFTTSDVPGAETAAAFKNVVAVAVGLAEGLADRYLQSALGASYNNARAAVFARGMLDMLTLSQAEGGRPATVLGLAGAGDLYVTCQHGRNGQFGRLLGYGSTVEGAVHSIGSTVEGVANTAAALRIGARSGIDLPSARVVELALTEDLTGETVSDRLRDMFLTVVTGAKRYGDPAWP
jgi:glycerol-3-phosphate dehydrogenase (NAD(P)+)